MTTEADHEQAELANIGDAPEYFGKQALAWVKAHPKDPRNSEVLGFALRAMRNGCNLENSYDLKREIFTILHTRYPNPSGPKNTRDRRPKPLAARCEIRSFERARL